MPRRRVPAKREPIPDPIFRSKLVTRCVNVIMGRLIPAGTGFTHYRKRDGSAPDGVAPEGGEDLPEEPAA